MPNWLPADQPNMDLDQKIQKSIAIFRQAEEKFTDVKKVLAFTGGKDSTVMVDLAQKAFGVIPHPAFYIDSGLDHKETEDFIVKAQHHWGFDLIPLVHYPTLDKLNNTKDKEKRAYLARILKIKTIEKLVREYKCGVIFTGIRHDEHPARAKETPFSPRDTHWRVHPILHFTEKDIWDYIHKYKIPYNPLYDLGYRSLGEQEFTKKPLSKDAAERAGREQDKEELMSRLRQLGYF